MTCLVWAGATKESGMSDCAFQSRVQACHDGELGTPARFAVEQHLARCPACAAELDWLRQFSASVAGARPAAVTDAERSRIHDAVDAAADADADESASYPMAFYRAAAALAAVAASILLLSAVWLNELPAAPRGPQGTRLAVTQVPAWERVAVNLRVDPVPSQPFGDIYLADARLADWMLQGLAGQPGGTTDENR